MNRRNPFASRVDGNAAEIDAGLEAAGVSVLKLDMIGQGCPDRLLGFQGRMALVEYKHDYDYKRLVRGKPYVERVRGKLTPDQQRWIGEWRGTPVVIARTLTEALAAVGIVG